MDSDSDSGFYRDGVLDVDVEYKGSRCVYKGLVERRERI